jgi:ABC-type glucose/galactose transport system permease subunit
MTAITGSSPTRREREFNISWTDVGPFLALAVLLVVGFLINPDFLSATNLANVVTRSVTVANLIGQAPVRGTVKLDAPLITQANAKEYYFPDSPF